MKKRFLPFVLFIISMGFAQNNTKLKVTESAEFSDDVKSGEVLSMHTTESGLTGVIRNSKKHLLFDVFNESLGRIKNSLVETDKDENFCGELFFSDIIKVFTVYAPSKIERIVYCHEFNLTDGSHKKTELFKADVEKNQSLFSGANKRQTGFSMSRNGDYFVISTDDIKKNSNSYTVRVYNSKDLSLLYQKSYQENTDKFYEPNDIFIDNSANVYALGKLFIEGRSQKKEGKANYNFVLNKLSEASSRTINIDLNEKENIKSLIISNNEEKIRLIGFYSEKRVNNIKCVVLFNVDCENMTVSEGKSFNLPEEVYKDLYSENTADRKKDKELSSFYVDYFIEDNIGNTYLLAEEFYVTTIYVSTGMGGGYMQTVHHFDDVLVLKLNAEGQLEWGRSIFKRATAPSYNAFVKNNELHVILNSGKSLTEKEDGRVKISQGLFESSSLYDIEYSQAGDVTYNKIQDNKNSTFYVPYFGVFNLERFITISAGGKKQFLILE